MANGTASPLSDWLSPMCAVGEQIESEFGLDLEHRSAPGPHWFDQRREEPTNS